MKAVCSVKRTLADERGKGGWRSIMADASNCLII